jgi:hypothetical protein
MRRATTSPPPQEMLGKFGQMLGKINQEIRADIPENINIFFKHIQVISLQYPS